LILKVRAGAYSIEAANARHEHEWQVWKDVKLPDGKRLIPGVVSHQTNVVEHPELVAERILRFAKVVGRANVMAGTDCGFAQGHPSCAAFIRPFNGRNSSRWPRAQSSRPRRCGDGQRERRSRKIDQGVATLWKHNAVS
jgi:hypothetical protein